MGWFTKELTIGDLMNIDPGRIKRSELLENVKLVEVYNILREESILGKILRFFKLKTLPIFYKVVKYNVLSNSGSNYTVFIKVSPGFDVNRFYRNKVQVFCSCADFKYRAAYLLNKHDNVYLNQATKDFLGIALTTAPTRVNTTPICKHVYAAIEQFKLDYKKLGFVS